MHHQFESKRNKSVALIVSEFNIPPEAKYVEYQGETFERGTNPNNPSDPSYWVSVDHEKIEKDAPTCNGEELMPHISEAQAQAIADKLNPQRPTLKVTQRVGNR